MNMKYEIFHIEYHLYINKINILLIAFSVKNKNNFLGCICVNKLFNNKHYRLKNFFHL